MSANTAQLHTDLVDLLIERGTVHTHAVEAALRAVPRHPFIPATTPEVAYGPDDAVVTKRGPDGAALSSASAPYVVSAMLEQADIRPGMRILEIGAGTGYNAALLAELTGPDGHVVTIDIDPDVADEAWAALAATGYGQVEVLCADGADGYASGGPYDRIIVTVGAFDLPAAWWQQLAPTGRLVVPLQIINATSRSIAFDRDGDHLTSRSMMTCGFLAMRGIGSPHPPAPPITLADGVQLLPGDGHTPPPGALADTLTGNSVRHWTTITIRPGPPFQSLDLWLATTSTDFARIVAHPDAITTDLATPAFRWGGAATTNHTDSLAYLTIRPTADSNDFELGVRGHGPHGDALAATLTQHIQHWDRHHRNTTPRIDAHLKPAHINGPTIIEKPTTLLTVTW